MTDKNRALQALHDENERLGLYKDAYKQEQGESWGHGGRPMTLRECMEAEEPKQGHSFTYAQMKEHAEGLQRDYDLLLAEYNLLKQEQGEPVAWMYPDARCDRNCLYLCTKGFTQFPECATTLQQRKPLTDEQKSIRVWGWVWKDKRHEGDLYSPSYTPAQHVPRGELLALVDPADLHNPLENTAWHIPTKAAHGIKE